ncbi:hypothetical protein GALL_451990 [mine drainage metagenome]|uniref:Uncharacterized protein n=1 Tax=mine drainage metagenome TaxID=410659 RepID=A0A1J5PQU6_9ZZZZ
MHGQVLVLQSGKTLSQPKKGCSALFTIQPARKFAFLLASALCRVLGVIALKELLWIPFGSVQLPFGKHDMGVRLGAPAQGGDWVVDCPNERVTFSNFTINKFAHKFNLLQAG